MNIWHDIVPSRITTKSFEAYIEIPNGKSLEHKQTTVKEICHRDEALEIINKCMKKYEETFVKEKACK